MTECSSADLAGRQPLVPRDWVQVLARYRDPNTLRSLFELGVTLVPFVVLWGVAWWALSVSVWLALGIALLNGGFLVRLFAIQHDCGHSSFFSNRLVSDWVGRVLGVMTLTPYDVWRRSHSMHHSMAGNLDHRGIGDIYTLTVREYFGRSHWQRFRYRLYRHPLVLFGVAPGYLFLIQNRLPFGFMNRAPSWVSAMATNLALALVLGAIVWLGGLLPLLVIFLPTSLVGASIGVWLFYVQHQFEDTCWDHGDDWQVHDAALHGSSHYVLPGLLAWMTAYIGVHHVHHLYARIPFYRLRQVLRDHPALAEAKRMTLWQSLACVNLHLWDEGSRRLMSYRQARHLMQA